MLSERLATLDFLRLDAADVSAIVAEEIAVAIGARRAVVWVHRPLLGAFVVEQRHRDVRSIQADGVVIDALAVRGDGTWQAVQPGRDGDEWLKALTDASFGLGVGSNEASPVVVAPLATERALVGAVVAEGIEAIVADGGPVLAQAAAVLANHEVLAASRQHEAQLEALYRTAGELSARLELPAVLDAIVDRARQLVGAPIAYIMLLDPVRGEIYMRTTAGVSSPDFADIRLEFGTGLGGMTAEREQAFYTSDYLNDARFTHFPAVDAEVRREGIRSILGTPLRASDEFLGVLFVADRVVRIFTDAELDVLASLAHHAAVAIDNATLYEQTSRALETARTANATVEERNRRLRRLGDAHARLSDVALAGHGLSGITHVTSELLGGAHVTVLDERLAPLACAGEPPDAFADELSRSGLQSRRRVRPDVRATLAATDDFDTAVLASDQGHGRVVDRLLVPVVARTEVLGTVWATIDVERIDEDRALVEQAARVMALELLKERSVAETERRLRRELLDDLLAERAPADEALRRRARDLGIDLARPYRLAVIAPSGRPASGRGDRDRGVRDQVIAALRRRPWCAFAAERGSRVIALIEADAGDWPRELGKAVDALDGAADARTVFGSASNDIAHYRSDYIAATRVLDTFGPRLRERAVALEDMRVLMLLFREGGERDVREFRDARLAPLLGRGGGRELVTTLGAWLDSGASPGQTATALHVHVNTVYYRVRRLRELLGGDFDEPQRALDLRVALLAHRLLHSLEETSNSDEQSSDHLSVPPPAVDA